MVISGLVIGEIVISYTGIGFFSYQLTDSKSGRPQGHALTAKNFIFKIKFSIEILIGYFP
jgi:hypothetical protein